MTRANAVLYGKAATSNRCIFTGLSGADGMHWYAVRPFPALADVPENIFAGVRGCHSVRGSACFDWKQVNGVDVERPVSERRWILENLSLDEFRPLVRKKIHVVGLYCEKFGIEFPDAEQPSDHNELRLRGD